MVNTIFNVQYRYCTLKIHLAYQYNIDTDNTSKSPYRGVSKDTRDLTDCQDPGKTA